MKETYIFRQNRERLEKWLLQVSAKTYTRTVWHVLLMLHALHASDQVPGMQGSKSAPLRQWSCATLAQGASLLPTAMASGGEQDVQAMIKVLMLSSISCDRLFGQKPI